MYLIVPINSPINEVSLPVSLIGVDRLLTGWLTGEKFYKNKGKNSLSSITLPDFAKGFSKIDRSEIDMSISPNHTVPLNPKKALQKVTETLEDREVHKVEEVIEDLGVKSKKVAVTTITETTNTTNYLG